MTISFQIDRLNRDLTECRVAHHDFEKEDRQGALARKQRSSTRSTLAVWTSIVFMARLVIFSIFLRNAWPIVQGSAKTLTGQTRPPARATALECFSRR
jgi:hypothetical protein